MKNVMLFFILLIPLLGSASTDLDGLSLNGMAVFSELKRPIYLASLYLENPQADAEGILGSDEGKAMELTVTASRWSSRRFSEQFSKALLINNELDVLKRYDVEVIEFSGVLKGSLKQGDKVIIRRGSKAETIVSVNGTRLLKLDKPGFYEMVLRVWIGARPPSTDFKNKLLSRSADPQLMDLYASLEPSPERVEIIASWSEDEAQQEQEEQAVAVVASAAPAIAAATVAIAAPEIASAAPAAATAAPVSAQQEKARQAEQAVTAKIEALAQAQPEAVEEDQEFDLVEQNKLLELYQHMVVRGILAKVKYPSVAVKRNLQGTAMLELTVNRRGEIISVIFLEETGHSRLDKAAKKAVADVGKFPAVPESLEGDEVSVKLPVKFILS